MQQSFDDPNLVGVEGGQGAARLAKIELYQLVTSNRIMRINIA